MPIDTRSHTAIIPYCHTAIIPCFQELVPPQYDSSDGESSDDNSTRAGLDIGDWGFELPPATGEESDPDMSDLWVVEDSAVVAEGKGRKYSLRR